EHELSPRSRALLEGLTGEYEIVIAGPLKDQRIVDGRTLQRVADVLDQFKRTARREAAGEAAVLTTLIDTGSVSGLAAFDRLLQRLVERDKERIARHQETIARGLAASRQLAERLEALAVQL